MMMPAIAFIGINVYEKVCAKLKKNQEEAAQEQELSNMVTCERMPADRFRQVKEYHTKRALKKLMRSPEYVEYMASRAANKINW